MTATGAPGPGGEVRVVDIEPLGGRRVEKINFRSVEEKRELFIGDDVNAVGFDETFVVRVNADRLDDLHRVEFVEINDFFRDFRFRRGLLGGVGGKREEKRRGGATRGEKRRAFSEFLSHRTATWGKKKWKREK